MFIPEKQYLQKQGGTGVLKLHVLSLKVGKVCVGPRIHTAGASCGVWVRE